MSKKSYSERDICTKFISPAIEKSGWNKLTQYLEEVSFTDGRIYVKGRLTTRGARKTADYILYYKPNIPIAIIEAKDNTHSVSDGMQQALAYAAILDIPFVFSSNGDGFLFHDKTNSSQIEQHLSLDEFPSPVQLWEKYADLFLILIIHLLKQGGRAGIVLPDGSLTGEGVKQRVRQKLLEDCNLHTIIRLPNSVFQPYATVATNLLFFTKGAPTKEVWYYEHRLLEGQKSYSKTKTIQLKEFDPIKEWWNNRVESDVCWKVNIDTIRERNFDLDIKNPNKVEDTHEFSSAELMEMLHQSFERSNELLDKLKEAVK